MTFTPGTANAFFMISKSVDDASDNILNQLMVKDFYRVKFLSAPLLTERLSYLQHLMDTGCCLRTTIRAAAEMQKLANRMQREDTDPYLVSRHQNMLEVFDETIYRSKRLLSDYGRNEGNE